MKNTNVYSLGIVLLEMLCRDNVAAGDIAYHLDSVWSEYPDFAKIIEQMTDRDPTNRLFACKRTADLYREIEVCVGSALTLYQQVYVESKHGLSRLLEILPIFIFGPGDKVGELLRRFRSTPKQDNASADCKRLLVFASVAEIVHTISVIVIAVLLLNDAGLLSLNLIGHLLEPLGIANINPGTWPGTEDFYSLAA